MRRLGFLLASVGFFLVLPAMFGKQLGTRRNLLDQKSTGKIVDHLHLAAARQC